MRLYSVSDPEFRPYGRIVEGLPTKGLLDVLKTLSVPEHVEYVPRDEQFHRLPEAKELETHLFGGRPCQFGWCRGRNTRLNCLEYHRSSEFNLAPEAFVLLLAKQEEIQDGKLDTGTVKAFLVPAGTLVEVYATSLHYAPCHTDSKTGFRVLVALPLGTNTARPSVENRTAEDKMLFADNKWLLAHPDSAEAGQGAWIGLTGSNIDLADFASTDRR